MLSDCVDEKQGSVYSQHVHVQQPCVLNLYLYMHRCLSLWPETQQIGDFRERVRERESSKYVCKLRNHSPHSLQVLYVSVFHLIAMSRFYHSVSSFADFWYFVVHFPPVLKAPCQYLLKLQISFHLHLSPADIPHSLRQAPLTFAAFYRVIGVGITKFLP